MNRDLQDKVWKGLSHECQDLLKEEYERVTLSDEIEGIHELENVFGWHNLSNASRVRLNLSEKLSCHIGKYFYNPMYGRVQLLVVDKDYLVFGTAMHNVALILESDGTYAGTTDLGIYPSRLKRNWETWNS